MMSVIDRVKNAFKGVKDGKTYKIGREERKRFGALSENGGELLDSTPMQPPIGYNPQPSMFDVMRKMIADHQRELSEAGYESPEEADDFDVQDDFDPSSPYEHDFDPPADPALIPEVPSGASREVKDPPADGQGTPPAGSTAGAASGAASPATATVAPSGNK